MLNLDTHILLYALTDDLTRRERDTLSRDVWSISAIVLWEISKLADLGRIELDLIRMLSCRRSPSEGYTLMWPNALGPGRRMGELFRV